MARDLASEHQPVSNFLDKTPVDSGKFSMAPEQVQAFHESGFVSGLDVLTPGQVAILQEELADLASPGHDGSEWWYEYNSNESTDPQQVLFHALGAWRIRPGFHDLLWHPGITGPASQLLSGSVRFWHDQLFCKPARDGGVVAWHQDYSYWTRTSPMNHLTVWIGLDDSDRENGCLQYIPGSHLWNLLPVTGLADEMDSIRSVLTDSQWEQFQQPVPVELKAGQCAIHHPLTVHGSFANRTARPRRAVVINLIGDGVESKSNQPLLNGVDVIPPGTPLQGKFFPLLQPV